MILLRSRSSVPPSQQQHPEGPLLNQQPQGPHRRQQQVLGCMVRQGNRRQDKVWQGCNTNGWLPSAADNQRLKHCRRPAAPIEASMQQQLIARQPAAIQRQGSNTATRYGINPTTYRICWRNTNSLLAHLFAG
ncbi:hypothetical protein V8C86DRAFT_3035626 [Haematococcus lacustris]